MQELYYGAPLQRSRHEIRVLQLQAAKQPNHEICANLQTVQLNDQSLQFEALSYTWGGSTQHHEIRLNGKFGFRVTDNLYFALRRLRHKRSERTIWIDAICINQENIDERIQQVTLMGGIYSKANRVLVWLGESEQDNSDVEDESKTGVNVRYWRLINEPNPFFFAHRVHHMFAALRLTKPYWWERAWVVQEAALAKKIIVHFGPCKLKWYWFEGLIIGARDNCAYDQGSLKEMVRDASNAVSRVVDLRRDVRRRGPQAMTTLSL